MSDTRDPGRGRSVETAPDTSTPVCDCVAVTRCRFTPSGRLGRIVHVFIVRTARNVTFVHLVMSNRPLFVIVNDCVKNKENAVLKTTHQNMK